MRPTRVLHLTPPGFGGIDAYIFGHYRHMDQARFRFDFMTQNPALANAEQYRDFSYKVWTLPAAAVQDRDGFVRNVREILRNGYDVLHLHTSYWTGFLIEEIARDMGVGNVIVHSHSTFIDEVNPQRRQSLLVRHEEIKRAFSPELATDYWACSRKAAGWLFGEQIPREHIRVMKNAIEVERFQFSPQKRKAARQEIGIEERALVLGTAGRLSYQKNHRFLIEVFAEFHRNYRNSKLLIIGDGELRGELEEQILKSGLEEAVLLPGWKHHVENYLTAMDCFLLPSRFEGLGIVMIEAAASGLPCIASEYVPDEVEISPKICRVPLETSAWLDALEEALNLPGERCDGPGIVKAAGYDVREQAKVLEALYEV